MQIEYKSAVSKMTIELISYIADCTLNHMGKRVFWCLVEFVTEVVAVFFNFFPYTVAVAATF